MYIKVISNFQTDMFQPGKAESSPAGFPRRLENLENENGHGKVMEHAKLAKSHVILLSVMEMLFATTEKLSICRKSAFSGVICKMPQMQN